MSNPRYKVVVHGSVFFESDDVLLVDEYARLTRSNWKNVKVVDNENDEG